MRISRRQFTQLSAMTVAANFAPKLSAQSSNRKVGYAVIGLGRIADHFMRGVQATGNSKITALVSGHPDKAARIAAQYGIPKANIYNYENMDSIRENHEIDAVYVALPNSMHAEYTIRSAKAGKHVLCEKPMSVSVPEAESMIAACKAANVKLMIAYRCHFEPTNLSAIQLIRDGAIGDVQQIQSAFGFDIGAQEWRLQMPLAGGGPMMDVGIYCLNATRFLTGEEPAGFSAFTHSNPADPRFKTVEENLNWITRFPSGIIASCNTTYSANMEGYYRVYGTKGWLEVDTAFSYDGLSLKADYRDHSGKHVQVDQPNPDKDPIHFTREADHFSDCILNNKTPKTPGEEGLRDLQCIREIYRSAGITMA